MSCQSIRASHRGQVPYCGCYLVPKLSWLSQNRVITKAADVHTANNASISECTNWSTIAAYHVHLHVGDGLPKEEAEKS